VDFHENYIYSAEDYFYSYEDYFYSAEDFLDVRRFFSGIFTNILNSARIIFIRAKILFLLVLTFFISIFLGKIAQNLREFTILFANIYEWSGALVKFHKDFFQRKSCVYSIFVHNMYF